MKGGLLVLGTMKDPHVHRVVRQLAVHPGIAVEVLDYNNDTRFALDFDENGEYSLVIDGRVLTDFWVWDRRKLIPKTPLYLQGDEEYAGFGAQEWRSLYTLIAGLLGDRVLNSLASRMCLIKPHQQVQAAKVGLRVPRTLLTNDQSTAISFHEGSRSVIMKTLSGTGTRTRAEGEHNPHFVLTVRVDLEDLRACDEHEIGYCPHFFQTEIAKQYERRIVYVDGKMFAFRIDSQAHKISEVDWRKGYDVVKYSEDVISSLLQDQLSLFMKGMGLAFGSIDIIVDRNGQDWFLECNQDGQWGWLDDIVDGQISIAFAEAFLKRLSSSARVAEGQIMLDSMNVRVDA